jgi:muconolactone delta-isomerase
MEFLTNVTTVVPEGTLDATVRKTKKPEAVRAAELAAQGHLPRLWRPPVRPGEWRVLGLCRAAEEQPLRDIIATLPLRIWMTVEVTPLTAHPSDPATQQGTEPTPNSATTCRSGMRRISATT